MEKIKFTKVEDLFDEEYVEELEDFDNDEFKTHSCHKNSAFVCKWFADWKSIGFCEGWISVDNTGVLVKHCFNSFIKYDGTKAYFDITSWHNNRKYGDIKPKYAYVAKEFSGDEIVKLFNENEQASFIYLDGVEDLKKLSELNLNTGLPL